MKKTLVLLILACFFVLRSTATIIYVDSSHAGGIQSGISWATAFTNFQNGIDAAGSGDSVWVAKGTYQPADSAYFSMKAGVKIFGGFLSTHTAFAQRNWQTYSTILKGHNNSVIRNNGNALTSTALLDGFTVRDGKSLGGGGMYNNNSSPMIRNCTFTANTNYSSFSANSMGGGGMYNDHASPVLILCTFTGNSTTSYSYANGAGMYNTYSAPIITDCTFSNNSCVSTGTNNDHSAFGGGIYNIDGAPVVTNCTFSNNTGTNTSRGAGMYNTNTFSSTPSAIVKHCTFTGNTCERGGGIYNYRASPSIDSCIFSDNITTRGAGAIYNGVATPLINACTFTNNTGNYGGGGAMINDQSGAEISNCTFTGNSSTISFSGNENGGGGAMLNSQSPVVVSNCSFTDNICNSTAGNHGGGGAIYNYVSFYASFTGCTFTNNTGTGLAGGYVGGGAIYIYNSIQLIIDQCTFTGNTGSSGNSESGGGGAIYSNSSTPLITDCIFSGNTGKGMNRRGGGGAIFNYDATIRAIDCSFMNNVATNTGGGGAICNLYASFGIRGCNFTGNKATSGFGGAIFNTSLATLNGLSEMSRCIFKADTAKAGGAIANYNGTFKIYSSLFVQNRADSVGGAVFNWNSAPQIINCSLLRNRAALNGSGMYNASTANPKISNSILWGNNTGIYNDASSVPVATYSLIQGTPANAAAHNLDGAVDPLFVDTAGVGNYQLQTNSPCINMGRNDSVSSYEITDLAGNARIYGSDIDMGAYEYNIVVPVVNLGNDTAFCAGNTVVLNTPYYSGSAYLWSTGATTQSIAVNTSGSYFVTITNAAGVRSDTIQVTVLPLPVVFLGNDTSIVSGTALTLDAGNPGAAYLWNNNATTQTMNVTTAGTYAVTVTTGGGCTASDAILISLGTGISQAGLSGLSYGLYPNPAREHVYITCSDPALLPETAILTNTSGQIIKKLILKNKVQEFSLSDLSGGIYFLKPEHGPVLKFVKE
jgi:hypothetical protein